MKKFFVILLLTTGFLVYGEVSFGQFQWGISDVNVSVTDTQWGLPFLELYPIHPGIELGTHFLALEKENTSHRFGAELGYFDHNVMAHAGYLRVGYDFQLRIYELAGIDLGAGAGYCQAIYPGEGYIFNTQTGQYESGIYHEGFFTWDVSAGISLVKFERIQPFLRYDFMVLENLFNQCSILQLGARIRLN